MKTQGFTLIELLVVIAILGLMSSIVVATLKGTRERGTLAAALQYAGYVERTQGDRAAINWKMDGNIGSDTIVDISGNSLNASFNTDNIGYDADVVTPNKKTSLRFNGFDTVQLAVTDGMNKTFTFGPQGFTMMMWIKPTSVGSLQYIMSRWIPYFRINAGGALFTRTFTGSCNGSFNDVQTTTAIKGNEWTHIAAVYGSDGVGRIYINGKEAGYAVQSAANNAYATCTAPKFTLGGLSGAGSMDAPGGPFFAGKMDDVMFINDALSLAEIQKHFAETAPIHVASN